MSLTLEEVADHLHVQGLVRRASIVRGDFEVTDISRRHHNLAVTSDSGRYFLKHGTSQTKAASIAHEAEVYRLLHEGSEGGSFVRYLPRLIDYDERRHVLVLEWVEDARNLREYHSRLGRFPKIMGRMLGEALGRLHGSMMGADSGREAPRHADSAPSWILSVHRPSMDILREASGPNLELIKIIQQFPGFGELLDELRDDWSPSALIHRDLKWDNCLHRTGPVPHGESNLKIVDWELAGIGDPCWDAGSVFNDYLAFWLLSIPTTSAMIPGDFLKLARYPLEKMHPALHTFWTSYARRLRLDPVSESRWQLRSVRYAAARLLQTAFEQMQMSSYLTGNVICSLQLSFNMLQRPGEAAIRLLGLPPLGTQAQ